MRNGIYILLSLSVGISCYIAVSECCGEEDPFEEEFQRIRSSAAINNKESKRGLKIFIEKLRGHSGYSINKQPDPRAWDSEEEIKNAMKIKRPAKQSAFRLWFKCGMPDAYSECFRLKA